MKTIRRWKDNDLLTGIDCLSSLFLKHFIYFMNSELLLMAFFVVRNEILLYYEAY